MNRSKTLLVGSFLVKLTRAIPLIAALTLIPLHGQLLIHEAFNDLDPSLDGNTPGPGLDGTWSPGESNVAAGSLHYGALAQEGGRVVTNPGDAYDENGVSPGTTLTDAGLMADGATLWFSVLIVKAPQVGESSDRRIYVSLGTGAPDGFDRVGDDSGSGFTVAVNKVNDEGVTAQAWNDGSNGSGGAIRGATDLSVVDGETFLAVGKIIWGEFGVSNDVFELYLPDKDLNLGTPVSTIEADFDQLGTVNVENVFDTIGIAGGRPENFVPEVDEIRFGASYADVTPLDVTAPVLVSTDPVDDSSDGKASEQIATFNEPIFPGTGDIRIVNETDGVTTTIPIGDPRIEVAGKTLTITPTNPLEGGKAYHIEIDAGAVTDYNLNDFAGLTATTDWNFIVDESAPTVLSIEDDTSPLPILINSSLVYTITFSEAVDIGTLETTDFANGGSAPVTVDSVSPTADAAVYEVAVSTGSTSGDLTLEIVAGAVIEDLSGNALDTSVAIPDDTTISVNEPAATAATLGVDFQATIASEQHPDYEGEARYFHVSVHPDNPGTGSYAATIAGTNDPAATFVRNYAGPVVAYKFVGGSNNELGDGMTGGEDTRISYATEDSSFDGFNQQQAKVWDATDPGSDLAISGTDPYNATADKNSGLFRSLGGAVSTIDISGLESGSLHIYYGAFGTTPSVRVTMRDTDNVAEDITLADVHLNGDEANRTEYYLAEVDFVTDGYYDVIEYEWLANGTDYSGNGRGLGTVLTGPDAASITYADWASQNGVSGTFDGDDDMDGVANGVESIMGTDPNVFSQGLFQPGGGGAGTDLTFQHAYSADPPADVTVSYEWSPDLSIWYASGETDGGTGTTVSISSDQASPTATVTVSITAGAATELFIRMSAVLSP